MTFGQLFVLYEHSMERELMRIRMLAAIHGVDLKDDKKEKTSEDMATMPFGAPEDYDHLSPKEREELTGKMIGAHKKMSGSLKQHGMG